MAKMNFKEKLRKVLSSTKDEFKQTWLLVKSKPFLKWYSNFVLFGLLLTGIYALFKNQPEILSFNFQTPKIWTFYTHSFYHHSWNHLLENLFAYTILVTISSIVFYKNNLKEEFNKTGLWIILLLPFVVSILNKIMLGNLPKMAGSSDLVSALLGVTFYALVILIGARAYLDRLMLLLCYLLPLLIIVKFDLSFTWAFILFFSPTYIYALLRFKIQVIDAFVFILALVAIAHFTIGAFPNNVVNGESLINVVSHFIGLTYGLIIGYVIILKRFNTKLTQQAK